MKATDLKKQLIARSCAWCWWIGRHAFLAVLVATIINIGIGGCLFYYYVALPVKSPKKDNSVATFLQGDFDQLLEQQQKAAIELEAKSTQVYNDPFR